MFIFLQILYADSLDVPNLQIPTCRPRIAVWTRNLLDQIIKLDTNREGSFGRLKVRKTVIWILSSISFFSRPSPPDTPLTHDKLSFQLKESCHSVGAGFALQMDGISRFVTSKAPRQLPLEVSAASPAPPCLFFCSMSNQPHPQAILMSPSKQINAPANDF